MSTPFDRRLLWVHWQGEVVRENSIEALADNIRRQTPNVRGLVLKSSDGGQWQGARDQRRALAVDGPNDLMRWVRVLADRDLELHLWAVVRGENSVAESDVIMAACQVYGVHSMLLHIDDCAGRTARDVRDFVLRLRAGILPGFHLGINFDPRNVVHLQEWLPHVQSLHPTVFHWESGMGHQGPEALLDETFGKLARYGLPVVPMLQTFSAPTPVPEAQLYRAAEYAAAKGAAGLTFFRYGGENSAPQIVSAIRRLELWQHASHHPPAVRVFQVDATHLRVREAPALSAQTIARYDAGAITEVETESRTEADGYVWWRGEYGWLAQGRIDRRQTLLVELTPGAVPDGLPLLDDAPTNGSAFAAEEPHKRFRVLTNAITIRSQPDLNHEYLLGTQLRRGDEVTVDPDAWTEKDGFIWWFHGSGWSAEKAVESNLRFMEDLTPEVPRMNLSLVQQSFTAEPLTSEDAEDDPLPEPVLTDPDPVPVPDTTEALFKEFRVVSRTLNIRSQPGLAQRALSGVLRAGDEIRVRADAWRELDGYIWWQHGTGWSVEASLDDRQRFMIDLTPEIPRVEVNAPKPAPVPITPPPTPAPLPEGVHRYRVVALGVTIRDEPNTNAIRTGRLRQGEELLIASEDRVEADGYIWLKHAAGWSAERSTDDQEEYILNIDALPLLGTLFQRLPVRLAETDWVQYYGNTSFAYRNGTRYSYHKFAQGLHSGLDLGKSLTRNTFPPVFAAVDGLFDGRGQKYGPNRVDVLVDKYRIIYGHLGIPANLRRRALVTPDTVMGMVENSQIHTHIEVRYRDRYIINPLLLMPQTMVDELLGKFPPEATTFFKTDSWQRWLTPLDQPVIRLGGELIGPTASR